MSDTPPEEEPIVYPPLPPAGSLATLLVVVSSPGITLEDAAATVRVPPEHLIAEAEAWAVASIPNPI